MSADEAKGLGVFENLSLIPTLLEEIKSLNLRVMNLEKELIPDLNLTKRADVKKYLDINEGALKYRMEKGELKQGIHYIKEIKDKKPKITFIEGAIIEYKGKR